MADKTQLFKQALKLFEQLPEGADLSSLPHGREPTVNDTKQDLEAAIAALAILQGQPISESSPTAPESSAGDASDASETSQKDDEQPELDKAFAAALKYWSILQKKTPNELPKDLQVQKPRFLGMLRHLERQEPERLCELADELQKLANKVAPRPSQGLVRFLTRSLHNHGNVDFPADLQPVVTQLKACTAPQDLNRAIINLSVDEMARLKKFFQEEDNKLKVKEGLDSLRRKNEALGRAQPANGGSQQRAERQQSAAGAQKKERPAANDSSKSERPTFAMDPELEESDQSPAESTDTANSAEGEDDMDEASTKKLVEGELKPLDQRLQNLERTAESLSQKFKGLTPDLIQKLEKVANNPLLTKEDVVRAVRDERIATTEEDRKRVKDAVDAAIKERFPDQPTAGATQSGTQPAQAGTVAATPNQAAAPLIVAQPPWYKRWQGWVIGFVGIVLAIILIDGYVQFRGSLPREDSPRSPDNVKFEPAQLPTLKSIFDEESEETEQQPDEPTTGRKEPQS